jgi:hypothetical protein
LGIPALKYGRIFASTKAWTRVQINPAIDNTRVICCHDTKMLPGYSTDTSWTNQNKMVDVAKVGANLDQMAMKLAQKTTAAEAWSAIFRKPAAKTWASVRVALKTNGIGMSSTNRPRAAIYKKITDVLVDQFGVLPSNIVLFDACDDATQWYTSTYVDLKDSTKIRAVCTVRSASLGGLKAVALANASGVSCPADLVNGAIDILVNVAACKSHNGSGGHYNYGSCTLCMKSHFGTFTNTDTSKKSSSGNLHVPNFSATPPPPPLALFEINQHDAVLGGNPVRQQLCIVDALLSNGKSGPGGGFDNRTDRLVMGTFAPIVDYCSTKNILLNTTTMKSSPMPDLGVTNAAIILPLFLSSFGYAETDVQNSWIEYDPGTGVLNPSSREHSGRLVSVALSNPLYKRTVAHVTVPQSVGAMRAGIIDGRGRLIRNLSAGSGETTIVWDGLGDAGTPVSAGTYFVKIIAGTIHRSTTITVAR